VDDFFSLITAFLMKNAGKVLHHFILFNNLVGTFVRWLTFIYYIPDISKIFDYFEEIYNQAGRNRMKQVHVIKLSIVTIIILYSKNYRISTLMGKLKKGTTGYL